MKVEIYSPGDNDAEWLSLARRIINPKLDFNQEGGMTFCLGSDKYTLKETGDANMVDKINFVWQSLQRHMNLVVRTCVEDFIKRNKENFN